MAKPKLTDVAELAGVSPTTVSRVINKKGYLSQKTIDKVHESMRELNYYPNNLARSLQGKSTQLVGLIFPTLDNIFYAELINHLERGLFDHGYKTILCNSQHNAEKELDYLQMLQANQVDGIIAGAHNLNHQDYEKLTAPIVSFDRFLGKGISIVSSDNYQGGRLATQALLKHQLKHIMMITGSNDPHSPTYQRYQAYVDTMSEAGLEPHWIALKGDYSLVRKEMLIRDILKEHQPEGIFCSDDQTALLVLNQMKQLGLTSPEDIRLIGYDGTSFIQNYIPSLTTIQQPIEELASLLIDVLIRQIKQPDEVIEERLTLPVRLITGETC